MHRINEFYGFPPVTIEIEAFSSELRKVLPLGRPALAGIFSGCSLLLACSLLLK